MFLFFSVAKRIIQQLLSVNDKHDFWLLDELCISIENGIHFPLVGLIIHCLLSEKHTKGNQIVPQPTLLTKGHACLDYFFFSFLSLFLLLSMLLKNIFTYLKH